MIIDWTFFFGDTAIAQVTEDSVKADLNRFIARLEPTICSLLLGQSLYDELTAGLLVEPVAQKWKNLVDGCTYTDKYGNANQRWIGLANPTRKDGCIVNYVYYHVIGHDATQTTGVGEKNVEAENSTFASPIYKQTRAWNQMVSWNKQLRLFMQSSLSEYDTWNDPLARPVYPDARDLFTNVNNLNF